MSDFFAETCDVGINRAVCDHYVIGPHMAYDFLARIDAVAAREEKGEYLEFGFGQCDLISVEIADFFVGVYAQSLIYDLGFESVV